MLDQLARSERELELARAKLAGDLAVLRSPATMASFTAALKHEALEGKDTLVAQAKDAVQDKVSSVVEDLKAKAAANPAAALAIGAGIAWHLLRHPPITTALIGIGLFSLLRTNASAPRDGRQTDYVRQGKERLVEQIGELGSSASSLAADVGATVKERTGELFDSAKEEISRLAGEASDYVADVTGSVKAEVSAGAAKTKETAERVYDKVKAAADAGYHAESRDKVLLGVAGLAMAAAVGVACQRRIAEKV